MKAYQSIGYVLLNTTAVTAIVGAGTAGRVYHGDRANSTILPCINYYELTNSRLWGMGNTVYTINCRGSTASEARNLAEIVITTFAGADGLGQQATFNGFDFGRISLQSDNGTISESDGKSFNCPIDIRIIYRLETVS